MSFLLISCFVIPFQGVQRLKKYDWKVADLRALAASLPTFEPVKEPRSLEPQIPRPESGRVPRDSDLALVHSSITEKDAVLVLTNKGLVRAFARRHYLMTRTG